MGYDIFRVDRAGVGGFRVKFQAKPDALPQKDAQTKSGLRRQILGLRGQNRCISTPQAELYLWYSRHVCATVGHRFSVHY